MKIKTQNLCLIIALTCFMPLLSHALSQPIFTLMPTTPTTLDVPINSTGTVSYTLTNQTSVARTLTMTPITGISQDTSGNNCANPMLLAPNTSCLLSLNIDGSQIAPRIISGPKICKTQDLQNNTSDPFLCAQPSLAHSLNITRTPVTPPTATTLEESVSTLGLSISGTARTITVTNTGSNPATNVVYTTSSALPSGTTISPASCDTIAVADTCVLTITPGATPSATPGDTSPTPITLSLSGDNTNTLTPTLNVVDFGSVYQSGYIYDMDDTTPTTGSVGGKVVGLSDQAPTSPNGIIWSSNSSGTYDGGVRIFGISEISTTSSPNPSAGQQPGQTACNGRDDGACDTNNIFVYYENNAAGSPIDLSYYAAGLCKQTIDNYSDWYLPAICEMGRASGGSGCVRGTPNMQSNVPGLIGTFSTTDCTYGANCLFNQYWSSTEDSTASNVRAWYQFYSGSGTFQQTVAKDERYSVRCSRALTL
ncbi:MAG: hypothetical protein P1U36_01915 [Legionellaceae bacterium]|nr:hypothetical protein [Legionellaceae bacterium]